MEETFEILVVDDDEVDRMAVCRALKAAGLAVEVSEAADCAGAIAALKLQSFDCVLVDYCLPDADGIALVQAVREAGINVAVIALTGQEDTQIAVELMKAGASDYLSKGKLSPDILSSRLHNVIRIHRAEIQAAQATEKLKESEERYRLVLEGSNDGIWDWDISNNKVYSNDRFFDILGVPRTEFYYGTLEYFYERIHPEDQVRIKDAIVSHLELGGDCNVEFRVRHPNGRYRYCSCRGKAQRNGWGMPVRVAGIISDITERKEAEKELLKQHQRSHLFAELTLKIRQSLQIEEILQTTVNEILQLLGTDRVVIYRIWQDGSGTVVTEAVLPGIQAITGQNITDPCFRESYIQRYRGGRISAITDVAQADLQPCHAELLHRLDVKANLVVPILQREELWGLLIAHQCATAREWKSFEIELLQQLADQVGIALDQAQLLEKETRISQQLAEQNVTLGQALKDLQETQAQLIQAEKMSGLGQLVAGIAHEINNPVTFIYGNITPAQQYIQDLLDLLHLYQQHYPDPVQEIQVATEELDIEFIISDLIKVLSSMKVGAERIRQIVLSLRNFSRLDEAKMKPVNIHEGLDNTLLLLQHRLEAKTGSHPIEIVKEYGKLPQVECHAGQLNQVFMNILSNAIEALEEAEKQDASEGNGNHHTKSALPWIRIRTEVAGSEFVTISISDNGPGMTEEVCRRLFEPFFTTKPVGKGTGLGLAISYQIVVEKHGGELQCISAPGEGATFVIKIPIQQDLPARNIQGDSCPLLSPAHGRSVEVLKPNS
ncbi:MAG: GAF domain-containing protein [Microcoleus vaginatus WJT46-NPBG5]|nr:GAF domain-containing protein [Microcoleus vaginatus WJT46-NPBG5]